MKIGSALPNTSITARAPVTIENPARMTAFESRTLKCNRDLTNFGTLPANGIQKAAPPACFSPAAALDNAGLPRTDADLRTCFNRPAGGAALRNKRGGLLDGALALESICFPRSSLERPVGLGERALLSIETGN